MAKKINSPVKFNLTLRVLNKKKDNFHEIFTVFWKKNGLDELTITPIIEENTGDSIETRGVHINGENIAARALGFMRRKTDDIPPLRIVINKRHPIGSGIGAGSGNAAVVLLWLTQHYGIEADICEISQLGADVAFLAAEHALAQGEGIGDVITPLSDIPRYRVAIAYPKWVTTTAAAYERLDELREEGASSILSEEECKTEATAVLNALRLGSGVGMLPNDFLDVYSDERAANYKRAFNIYEAAGALAWGLCGSGSAVYALFTDGFDTEKVNAKIKNLSWVKKTAELE